MLSKVTLVGLHNFSEGSIWDDIAIPEGLDKDVLISEIIREAAEFPLLYPDEDYMKLQIKSFFLKWQRNFEKWYSTYKRDYEALYNVDVITTTTEKGTNVEHGSTSGGSTNTNRKASYESGAFQNASQDTLSANSISDGNSSHDVTTEEVKQGNQGVTMSQEMWLMEQDLWYWNLYKHIAEIFVNEFCICIYT